MAMVRCPPQHRRRGGGGGSQVGISRPREFAFVMYISMLLLSVSQSVSRSVGPFCVPVRRGFLSVRSWIGLAGSSWSELPWLMRGGWMRGDGRPPDASCSFLSFFLVVDRFSTRYKPWNWCFVMCARMAVLEVSLAFPPPPPLSEVIDGDVVS